MGFTSVTRRYRFCAAHRLHTDCLSAEENRAAFPAAGFLRVPIADENDGGRTGQERTDQNADHGDEKADEFARSHHMLVIPGGA